MKSIEWAAGLFEGEGSITKIKDTLRWQLAIEMSDLDVIEAFHNVFDLETKITHRPVRQNGKKPTFVSQTRRQETVKKILELLLPYLGERRTYKALNCLDDIDNFLFLKNNGNIMVTER